jgi:hypothetical protein
MKYLESAFKMEAHLAVQAPAQNFGSFFQV